METIGPSAAVAVVVDPRAKSRHRINLQRFMVYTGKIKLALTVKAAEQLDILPAHSLPIYAAASHSKLASHLQYINTWQTEAADEVSARQDLARLFSPSSLEQDCLIKLKLLIINVQKKENKI